MLFFRSKARTADLTLKWPFRSHITTTETDMQCL